MICMDFDWQIDEFMVYCRSAQLREKSMKSYEQTLRLFERWCMEEMNILTVDKLISGQVMYCGSAQNLKLCQTTFFSSRFLYIL